jgi:hypothetical protein
MRGNRDLVGRIKSPAFCDLPLAGAEVDPSPIDPAGPAVPMMVRAESSDGRALADRGILDAPDYVVNAGGIINVAAEYLGETTDQVQARIRLIPKRLRTIFDTARVSGQLPHEIADDMAWTIINASADNGAERRLLQNAS